MHSQSRGLLPIQSSLKRDLGICRDSVFPFEREVQSARMKGSQSPRGWNASVSCSCIER